MGRFNAEFKESLLKKVFTKQDGISVSQLAIDANISSTTLYCWIKKSKGAVTKVKNDNYKSEEKFEYCLKYFNLEENKKGEYLRYNGLYSYQLESWKKDFINIDLNQNSNKFVKDDKRKIRILEKELRRKEKALAETATLLTLKKKFCEMHQDEE
jgi:transposase